MKAYLTITAATILVLVSMALTYSSSPPPLSSLCAATEQIVFNCSVKRSAKIVSLCASKNLTKEAGYLQYRFGLPGKIELEFPKTTAGTQQAFHYWHYFRYQFDQTGITFNTDGYEYQIYDTYDGQEKPKVSEQGVNVKLPGKTKETTFVCQTKARANYSVLQDVLPNEQQ